MIRHLSDLSYVKDHSHKYALISSKLNQMVEEGWELALVVSGVEIDAGTHEGYKGQNDGKGILSRALFSSEVGRKNESI